MKNRLLSLMIRLLNSFAPQVLSAESANMSLRASLSSVDITSDIGSIRAFSLPFLRDVIQLNATRSAYSSSTAASICSHASSHSLSAASRNRMYLPDAFSIPVLHASDVSPLSMTNSFMRLSLSPYRPTTAAVSPALLLTTMHSMSIVSLGHLVTLLRHAAMWRCAPHARMITLKSINPLLSPVKTPQHLPDRFLQLLDPDRFRDMRIHTSFDRPLIILRKSVRGQCNDRDTGQFPILQLPDRFCRLMSIHDRHLDIH